MPDIEVSEKLISFVLFLPMFFLSIIIHEFAHAFVAFKLGDNTAKLSGRLSFNPLKHIDLIGSVIMPFASFASGFALIGWAKPVPVNANNFKNILKDDAIVSVAGPLSNFLLAVIFFMIFLIVSNSNFAVAMLLNILWYGVFLNIFLFLFNLLPVPPLDGSHLLYDLFPNRFTLSLRKFGLFGSLLLLVFIYSPLWGLFMKLINLIMNLFSNLAVIING